MFSLFNNIKDIKENSRISLNQLNKMITTESEYSEKIKYLRSLEYGSNHYKKYKSKIGKVITPHGSFTERKNSTLVSLSGYLYFDIDNTTLSRNFIITKYKEYISFLCSSIGGRGFSFLVKVDNLTLDNFHSCYHQLRQVFIDLKLDNNAGGLSRGLNISYDEAAYINPLVSYSFKEDKLFPLDLSDNSRSQTNKRVYDTILNDPLPIIPFIELSRYILRRTQVKNINSLFKIEELFDYVYLHIPGLIEDGKKHFYYKIYIYQLMYLNPDITYQEVHSYLYHINKYNTGLKPMEKKELNRLTQFHYSEIRNTNDFEFLKKYMKKKKIHFIKNNNLTMKQKQSLAAKINGRIRTNKTIENIKEVTFYLERNNIKVTKENICDYYPKIFNGDTISISTVKRNWKKEIINDFDDLETLFDSTDLFSESPLIIEEDDFFK